MTKILVGKSAIAHHEAGHAVVARVLGIEVTYATLLRHQRGRGSVQSVSASYLAPGSLVALENDATVALAGTQAQLRYRPLSAGQITRAWEGDWSDDRRNAHNHLLMLFFQQIGEPIVLGQVTLEGERAEQFNRLFEQTLTRAAALVDWYWPAVTRVAAVLISRELITQADLDALIWPIHDRKADPSPNL